MVTRAELLEQLSALIGVELLDVSRTEACPGTHGVPRWHPSFRPRQAAEWWASAALETVRGRRPATTPLGPNAAVRNPRRLNRWASRLGRSPEAPPLTAEDGHAVLQLMYQIIENEEAPCRQT
jgi:hypothetical protein